MVGRSPKGQNSTAVQLSDTVDTDPYLALGTAVAVAKSQARKDVLEKKTQIGM